MLTHENCKRDCVLCSVAILSISILIVRCVLIVGMKLYRFELLFFDGTVFTGKFCVGVPLNIQSIYRYIPRFSNKSSVHVKLNNCICDHAVQKTA